MKPFRFIQPFLLLVLLQMGCRNTVSTEFGELTVNIEWSDLADTQLQKSASNSMSKSADAEPIKKTTASEPALTKPDTLPEISMVRITLNPGPIVHEFTEILPSYSIQAELGIYNILVEIIGQNGLVIFSADTSEILIQPPGQVQITLRIAPNYPTAAPEFIGLEAMNRLNIGDYHLYWTHVAKADTFQLEESTEPNFTSPVLLYSGPDTSFQVSGRPDGLYYYRVRAKNALASSPWSASVGFQLEIADVLKFLTTTVPNGVFGIAYQTGICFQGGTGPYDWQMQDYILPSGMTASLSDSCIIISGIPTLMGEFHLMIDIYDSGNPQQSVTFDGNLKIIAPSVNVLNATLKNGKVGVDYSDCYSLPDGLTGYQWVFSDYPYWLTVDINTAICFTGTPAIEGAYSWTAIGYHPDTPQSQTQIIFILNVEPAIANLTISTTTLSQGTEDQAYQTSICAAGGVAPYVYEIIQGELPAGLNSVSGACLEISGTPTEAGIYSFIIEATDNNTPPATAQKAFVIEIEATTPPLQITTQTAPDGYVEAFYQHTVCREPS